MNIIALSGYIKKSNKIPKKIKELAFNDLAPLIISRNYQKKKYFYLLNLTFLHIKYLM